MNRMDNLDPRLQLEPASSRTRLWLLLLTIVLPVSLSIVLPLLAAADHAAARMVGGNLVASAWPERLFGPLLVAAITSVVWFALDRLMRRHRLQFDATGLEVVTTFYRQKLALSELQLEAARMISVDEHPELKPMLKVNGLSLPGFRSGWFRSRALKKQFVATSGGEQLLWLPTHRGYALLLQPRQPSALLQRLRELAVDCPRR
ncbi:MAG: hypothetical protein ABI538_06465 [Pseudoxanthomonas sp.]